MKIIFFDIDGTLLPEGSTMIPESAKKAIRRARENGHLCFINTGRCHSIVGSELTDQVEFDGFLLGCGTEIIYHGESVLRNHLPLELTSKVIRALQMLEIDVILEASENIYSRRPEETYTKTFGRYIENAIQRYAFCPIDETKGFDKFFAYVEEISKMDRFREMFSEELDFVDRGNGYFEVLPKGYSKATAIRFLTNLLHLSMEDTVAIGDSNNDLSMFECAQISIGMGNSSQDILEQADYVTTDIMDDGIWNALEWLGVLE